MRSRRSEVRAKMRSLSLMLEPFAAPAPFPPQAMELSNSPCP